MSHRLPSAQDMLRHVFSKRGRIVVNVPSALNPYDSRAGWVECRIHKERMPIEFPPLGEFHELALKIEEAFDRCNGCIDLALQKAAKLFKAEAAKSRWPEGAEL